MSSQRMSTTRIRTANISPQILKIPFMPFALRLSLLTAFEKIEWEGGAYKIRFYFVPHDGAAARLFVYETPEMKL